MNLVLFTKCLYKGNIKYDFYKMLVEKCDKHIKHKLQLYYYLSKVNRHFENSYWKLIHQHFRLQEECKVFYESHQTKCNQEVISLLKDETAVLCDAPICLCKPFLPKQISTIIGYDFNAEKQRLETTELDEKKLIKKLKHQEIKLNTAIDYEASVFTKYAQQAWIYTSQGLKSGKKEIWKSIFKQLGIHILILLFFSCVVTGFAFLCSSTPLIKRLFLSYFLDPRVLFLSLFPVFMLMLLLYILTKRLWLSTLLGAVPFIVLAVANFFKLKYRDYPVVFSDLTLLSEATVMAGKYDITPRLWQIAFIAGFLLCIFILSKIKPLRTHYPIARILSGICILFIAYFGISDTMMNNDIYNNAGNEKVLKNKWIESQQLQRRGVIYTFIHSYKSAFEKAPEDYDEALAQKTLNAYTTDSIPEDKKVNIVAIMLESYNDFSKFDLTFSEDIYAPFHQIEKEGYYGTLISNVFGGGTVNTERSFLTGYFYHPLYLRKLNSYVQYFNDQGYQTTALHPCFGSFYNRRNVNEYLGFQDFYYLENRYQKVSFDNDFFPDILKEYQEKTKDSKPYFNFSLNYQGHGPYPTEKNDSIPDYLITDKEINENVLNAVNYYLNGIKNTTEHIKELHDAFQASDQPTIMVLFGDHNPVFGSGADGFEMIGINMDIGTKDGFLNYYSTPYVIWANDAAHALYDNKLPKGEKGPTISPNYLMNELFHYLGWGGNAYMKYTDDLEKEIPVLHASWKLIDGEWTQEVSEEKNQLIKLMRMVEYYYHYKIE